MSETRKAPATERATASAAAQRLLNQWCALTGAMVRRAEPWLCDRVEDLLPDFTEQQMRLAMETAARTLPRSERQRLTLNKTLTPHALRAWLSAAESKQLAPPAPTHHPAPLRLRLAVPYKEKEAARSAGAKWDAIGKHWYVSPIPDDVRPFAKWVERRHSHLIEPHRPAQPRVLSATGAAELQRIGVILGRARFHSPDPER